MDLARHREMVPPGVRLAEGSILVALRSCSAVTLRIMETTLTRRQRDILDFIRTFRREQGISPTHREICERFGYSSYGTVYKHLRLLREKGLLRRAPHQRRGVSLAGEAATSRRGERALPFLGLIAAGHPIETLPGHESMPVPDHLLGGPASEHYVLRVTGQSMVDEGIFDGDLVVVRRCEQADPGDMVVALVDGEATLKRYYPEARTVRLQPSNPAMAPLLVAPERVRVQGQVVGLMRRFA
jgi:repressor LexA